MKGNNNGWPRCAIFIAFVVCLAFVIDGLIFRQFNLEFHYDIQLTDIIGILVTIILALYLAYVVEEHRERKKAKTEILVSILGGLLSDVDALSNQIYDPSLPYNRLSTFTKMASTKIKSVLDVIQSLGIDDSGIKTAISSIRNKLKNMRPVLSEIIEKENNSDDYMVVSDGVVKELADKRIAKIQSGLAALRKQLYGVWLSVIALE